MPPIDTIGQVDTEEPEIERRTKRLTAAVTESEEQDATLVSAFDKISISSLLRVMPIEGIVARAAEIRSLSRQIEGAPV